MRRLMFVAVVALVLAGAARAAVPNPEARAFFVVNASNGEVLASRNAHAKLPIASITKLMTVLVALDHLKPSDVVTVPALAAHVGESRIPLRAGQHVLVHDLLAGALIQSANNAAAALAWAASAGDVPRFVEWMNARARKLGLRDTHFVRPDGLDAPGHVSSARDVAVLEATRRRVVLVQQHVLGAGLVAHRGEVRELRVEEVGPGGRDHRQRIASRQLGVARHRLVGRRVRRDRVEAVLGRAFGVEFDAARG